MGCRAAPPCGCPVALPAEGVDRNRENKDAFALALVALPAEGVDRNHDGLFDGFVQDRRPPHGGRG